MQRSDLYVFSLKSLGVDNRVLFKIYSSHPTAFSHSFSSNQRVQTLTREVAAVQSRHAVAENTRVSPPGAYGPASGHVRLQQAHLMFRARLLANDPTWVFLYRCPFAFAGEVGAAQLGGASSWDSSDSLDA